MSYSQPLSTVGRLARSISFAAVVVASALLAAVVDHRSVTGRLSGTSPVAAETLSPHLDEHPGGNREGDDRHLGHAVAAGEVPNGVTVFDDEYPAVANLDPSLVAAVREAATDAADAGVEVFVNGGWRSSEYQARLLDAAVSKYGSQEEVARWVATPSTSPHVSGEAIDIGHSDARVWLSDHGARYGLCQIYRNEPWHFELRPEAIQSGCPPQYADPTHDPRMQRPAPGARDNPTQLELIASVVDCAVVGDPL